MFIKKGKVNWLTISIFAITAVMVCVGLILYINDTVWQTNSLVQNSEFKKSDKTIEQNKIEITPTKEPEYVQKPVETPIIPVLNPTEPTTPRQEQVGQASTQKNCNEAMITDCKKAGGLYQIFHHDDNNPTSVCNCFKSCKNNQDCLLKNKDRLKTYCQFDDVNCSGTGVCEIIEIINVDEICGKGEINPECGCDGKTYLNKCYRVQAQVSLKKKGGCLAQKECAAELEYANLSGPIDYQYSCCYNSPAKTEKGLFCPSTMEHMPTVH
jgi:hypothetical protein